MSQEPTILGIDPGSRITGYGLIKIDGSRSDAIDFGSIRLPDKAPFPEKMLILFQAIEKLIEIYRPQAIAVETQFFHKNAQSAMKLGMARGLVILAAAKNKISLYEYAPKKAKLAVVGNGNASKEQVQKMIQRLLRLPALPEPEDAADALALALCHAHTCLNISKGR
jgi:crossover junction endodeoxyribonuclease RuvC